jgi:glycosyltransferase involved in cell wall biosynthesis
MTRRLFLTTPLRDEINNIERLFASVAAQDMQITCWVIVENGSTDGSQEALSRRAPPANVDTMIVLNQLCKGQVYGLGSKYAGIVQIGFARICSQFDIGPEDMIGILDADSFPGPRYYTQLSDGFDRDPKLGIASGRCVDDLTGQPSRHAADWVLGSCRIWRGACFLGSGYVIGPSADTLSLARAELDGWFARVLPQAQFLAREVGLRARQNYYGRSAHFRGNTPFYACLRWGKFLARGEMRAGYEFVAGYLSAWIGRAPRIEDPELRNYFARYVLRKLAKAIRSQIGRVGFRIASRKWPIS